MTIRRFCLSALTPLALLLIGCAPADDTESGSTAPETATSTDDGACSSDAVDTKTAGTLTIGTDSPAFEPWFKDNDPTNGEGFEAAVAYAIAEELGFDRNNVQWTKVPFNTSYKPGEKDFDFDINQISITPQRAKVVDFSDGYYQASQAVIALKGSTAAEATSLADLKEIAVGAQTGTTSLAAIRDVIKPTAEPLVFEDTTIAAQALKNGQVEAILADLPTAFYLSGAEIEGSVIVGQFQPTSGSQEEFGMLFEKGSSLVPCVNDALAALKSDGTLDQIEQEWLEVSAPTLN
jgi:polar amino acid transport system substrate-binding protein